MGLGELAAVDVDRLGALRREAIGWVAERGDLKYEAHGDLPEGRRGVASVRGARNRVRGIKTAREKYVGSLPRPRGGHPGQRARGARAITRAARAAAALKFPELHAKLQALDDSLAENARSKTADDGSAK